VGFADLLGITWSLCIQEHFYLIWPMLVRKFSLRALRKILWVAFSLSPAVRIAFFFISKYRGVSFKLTTNIMYHSTPFHLDPIIAGCLLGLYWLEWKQPERFRRLFFQMLAAGIVLFPVVWLLTQRESFMCCFVYTVLSTMFAGLVAWLSWDRTGGSF
jgi:peptidoglycan/LPS O-acetylase OafA/YrhL